jgi:hypothetical protein
MFNSILLLIICGVSGAMIYAVPTYLKAMSMIPPMRFAAVYLVFSLFVGALCALVFTNLIGHHYPWAVQPEPWPLAVVIGLGSNPLVPIALRRLEGFAETFGGKR